MLMAVVPNQKINALMQIVHEEDPKAFMFVHETYQAKSVNLKGIISLFFWWTLYRCNVSLPLQEKKRGKQDGKNT